MECPIEKHSWLWWLNLVLWIEQESQGCNGVDIWERMMFYVWVLITTGFYSIPLKLTLFWFMFVSMVCSAGDFWVGYPPTPPPRSWSQFSWIWSREFSSAKRTRIIRNHNGIIIFSFLILAEIGFKIEAEIQVVLQSFSEATDKGFMGISFRLTLLLLSCRWNRGSWAHGDMVFDEGD